MPPLQHGIFLPQDMMDPLLPEMSKTGPYEGDGQRLLLESSLEDTVACTDQRSSSSSSSLELDFSVNQSVPVEPTLAPTSVHAPPTPEIDRLSFMTFNIGLLEYRAGGMLIYENPPFTWKRLEHVPVALRAVDVDIIAIQELYDERQAEFLRHSLKLIYPFAGRTQGSGSSLALHNGLMVLSKFPILSTNFHPFSTVTHIERILASKGVLEVVISIPSIGTLAVFDAHLASGALNPESKAIEQLRKEETKEILRLCALANSQGHIPLVIGDLNSGPGMCPASWDYLVQEGWIDAFLEARRTEFAQRYAWSLKHADCMQPHMSDGVARLFFPLKYFPTSGSKKTGSAQKVQEFFSKRRSKLYPSAATVADLLRGDVITESASCTSQIFESRLETSDSRETATEETAEPQSCVALTVEQIRPSEPGIARLASRDMLEQLVLGHSSPSGMNVFSGLVSQRSQEHLFPADDWLLRSEFTWDPKNPLNMLGPHSGCHGLRCDHIFLPPKEIQGSLSGFVPAKVDIVFQEPRVLVKTRQFWAVISSLLCYAWSGPYRSRRSLLVTLSDHHAVVIELIRKKPPPPQSAISPIGPQPPEPQPPPPPPPS